MVGKVFHPGVMGHGIDGGLFWLRARVLCFEMFGATLFDEDTPHFIDTLVGGSRGTVLFILSNDFKIGDRSHQPVGRPPRLSPLGLIGHDRETHIPHFGNT